MTRREDGSFRPSTREAASHPLTQVLALVAAAGVGTGAFTISRTDVATKEDVARIERKVDAIQADVAILMIEKRAREWAETHKVTQFNQPGGMQQ